MASCKVKAAFFDMDGTLLNSEHTISPRTVAALHELKKRGVAVIVATGRPYPDVFANLVDANLSPDFTITSNGARVHDEAHNIIFACDMNAEIVCKLFQLSPHLTDDGFVDPSVPARPLLFNVNCRDRWFTNKCVPEVRKVFHTALKYEEVDPHAHTPESLEGTHSGWVRSSHEDLLCVKKYIDRELSTHIGCAFALPHILDYFTLGMTKGVGMDKVCEHLGITRAETIAFGDGMNDVQMLQQAGQGFLMANAPEMVKMAAAHLPVVPSNNEEGVACKLEELLATDAFNGGEAGAEVSTG